MRRLIASFLLLLAPFSNAWSISVADLPAQLQACIGSNECSVNVSAPVVTIGNMEAYLFADNLTGTPVTGFALRYSLQPPSARYSNDQLQLPFLGDVWLTVQDSYDLAGNANRMTIYTDTVTPQPGNLLLGDSNGLDIAIDLTNDALLNGAGTESIFFIDANYNTQMQGNMRLLGDIDQDALSLCLAEECGASALLNLVYLQYLDQGNGQARLQFNPNDPRARLYEIINGYFVDPAYAGSVDRQSYYVAAVPVPATVWLMLSGLLVLSARLRRVSD